MRRLLLTLPLMAGLFALVFLSAPSAEAAGIPGVDVCPKNAPFAVTPKSGLAGMLGERPNQITTDIDPQHIWTTGGFAGLRAHTYDLGCAIDPTSWFESGTASASAGTSNVFLDAGNGIVALTDSLDRRAWEPGYVVSILKDFAQKITGVVNERIIVPFLGLALLGTTILMIWSRREGDLSGAASGMGWMLTVLTISSLLLIMPMMPTEQTQKATGWAAAAINSGQNPSDAVTNSTVYSIQYQGWLRRNFGIDDTEVAVKYGPSLLDASRVSWKELDEATTPEKRKALVDAKEKQFKDIAAQIEDEDPIAYRHMTGRSGGWEGSIIELLFVLSASSFRLMNSMLIIACEISITLLATIWLILTPALLPPRIGRFSGQELGMDIINSVIRAMKYVLTAVVSAWLFGIYLQTVMAPGMSLWWSLLLLIIGTCIAWTVTRPDRKFLSIISLGRVEGYGYLAEVFKTGVKTWAGGAVAGAVAASVLNDDEPPRMSEASHPAVHADIYHPTAVFSPEQPTHVDGESLPAGQVWSLPSGIPYEPTVHAEAYDIPSPPPDDSSSPYIPYERSDDNEGART